MRRIFSPHSILKKERIMPRTRNTLACLAVAALSVWPLAANAAPVTWIGDVDNNWSTDSGPGDTNWDTNTVPANGDTATFHDAPAGVSTVVDAATTIDYLTINQSTTSETNLITLGATLTIDANNTTTSGITYGSTISNAAMFEVDFAGFSLDFTTNANGAVTNLYGTYTMDTTGSRARVTDIPGTGAGDAPTINLGGGSNLAAVNVTANGTIGHMITPASTTTNNSQTSKLNIGAGSQVSISNNATLDLTKRMRVASNVLGWQVNNAGTVTVASGSTLDIRFTQVNNSNNTVGIELNNVGTMNHIGKVALTMADRGTATINNTGTWKAGAAAIITAELVGQGTGDTGTASFVNQPTGILTNASSGSLDYNPLDTATFLNQVLTITNQGAISPGAGHNGSGLSSVGTFTMTDIAVTFTGIDATLRIDLGGLGSSNHDVLTLTNGDLTLDADSNLELFYVNGFNGMAGDSWTILNYASLTGTFDLASNLSITGGSGMAANPANYSITYGPTSAVLRLVPEPASLALLAASGLCLLPRRKRAGPAV